MSDHWNLLADLLGTPNYAPRSKKGAKNAPGTEPVVASKETAPLQPQEDAEAKSQEDKAPKPRRTKATKPRETAPVELSSSPEPENVQQTSHEETASQEVVEVKERSMLQSSWDALASIFGVAGDSSREPKQVSQPPSGSVRDTAGKAEAAPQRGPKSKRTSGKSMWDNEEVKRPAEVEQVAEASDAPLPSFAAAEPTTDSDRRGPRRSPRRGRGRNEQPVGSTTDHQDTRLADPQPNQESSSFGEERSPRRERSERNDSRRRQADRQPDRQAESGMDQDREPRRSRSSDEYRGPRDNNRGENSRSENSRSENSRSENSRSENSRIENSRSENSRGDSRSRGPRDDRRRERNPSSQAASDSTTRKRERDGFAAGLSNDFDSNDQDDRDLNPIGFDRSDDFHAGESDSQAATGFRDEQDDQPVRRKKRRGRRRDSDRSSTRSESTESDSQAFGDFDESDRTGDSEDARPRHGKIPSWSETIGVVVESNVANHQKQSTSGRSRQRRPNN